MVALPAPSRHRARASFPRTPAGAAQQIGVALKHALQWRKLAPVGDPADEILEAAKQFEAD
jgi:hypothetical protein